MKWPTAGLNGPMAAATKATALWVLRRLRAEGYQALLAGGCVRDMLLGVRSSDYDVATSATPDQVKRLFHHVLLVGAKFGVAMVIHNRRKVEVTTFRSDLSYQDGRRPVGVEFSSPEQDAKRRDFTINGMFCDPLTGEIIDYVGGREDLKRGILRTIGPADERFSEDYLRMIRAVRFAVRLNFRIEPATATAVAKHAAKITSISGERVFEELSKMLVRPSAAAAVALLEELGLRRWILPELSAREGLFAEAVAQVDKVANHRDLLLSLGALLAALSEADIEAITRRWGSSNEIRRSLIWLSEHLDDWQTAADPAAMPTHRFKRLLGGEDFQRLRRLWRVREQMQTGKVARSVAILRRARSILPEQVAPSPLVTGADLMELGLSQGPALGRILRKLYDAQLDEEIQTRPQALTAAAELVRQAATK